jgi:hypothetical protein
MTLWRRMLAVLVFAAAAWLLHVFGRVMPLPAALAAWSALAAATAFGLARRARIRRAAFVQAYVHAGSPLARWLRGRWLIPMRAALLGAALALFLAVALVRLDASAAWAVLVVGAAATALVFGALERWLAPHASSVYLPELAWRGTMAVVGGLMFLALVWLGFLRAHPDLAGAGLESAVWHFVEQEGARSAELEVLLQLAAAKDALRLWLAQQLMPQPGASLAEALGWVVVLAEEALFVWSYLLYLSPVLVGSRAYDDVYGPR